MNQKLFVRTVTNIYMQNFIFDSSYIIIEKLRNENYIMADALLASLVKLCRLSFLNKVLSCDEIISYYVEKLYLGTRKVLPSQEQLNKIIKLYNQEDIESLSKFILEKNSFGIYSLPMLSIFINTIRSHQKKELIVIRASDIKNFNIKVIENRSKKYWYPHKYVPLEMVISKLKELNKKELKELGIDSIYLFGSYAKNRYDEYSDVDLLICLKEEEPYCSVINDYFYSYVKNSLSLESDIVVYKQSEKDNFVNNQLNYAIKII